jgi:hypothetical protein
MKKSMKMIENRTSKAMRFHVEPECVQFEVPVEKTAEVSGKYESEPIRIQFSDDEHGGIFGAVFPGESVVIVKIDGQTIVEIM